MPDTSFMDDVIFPVTISWGSMGGPDWLVDIVELGSGHEERNTSRSQPTRIYDAKYGVRTHDELHKILSLYHVAMGPTRGFRLLDWTDYKSCPPQQQHAADDQVLGTGDGAATVFLLNKVYAVGAHSHTRRIQKPFEVLVAVDGTPIGTGFTVDMALGKVAFDAAPGVGEVLTWGGKHHVPARFNGKLDQVAVRGPIGDIPAILLKELLVKEVP
ncbi:MAG: TIGR02217 family protein [Rhizobiales bacterium]|nr:TIGR02217 family protein [Hyphomicrobiales bacterium]